MTRKCIALFICTLIAACSSDNEPHRVVGELASDRIELTAEFAEPIVEITVAEGSPVRRGDVLLRLDSRRAEAELADTEAAWLQAAARRDELLRGPRTERITAARANVEGATQELEFRQSEQQRVAEVYSRGLASAETRDRANAALDAADANLKLRLAELEELLAGTTLEELEQVEQVVAQAAARLARAQVKLERHVISAPVDGIVDSRLFEMGERPGNGQPVLIVLAASQPYARVYVPETIRVHIQTGSRATIHVDGLDSPIRGRVRWVASEAAFTPYYALTERDRGRLSYVAKVDIDEERDRLPDGVPVEVVFELGPDGD